MDDIDTESTTYTRAYNALITQAKTALKNTSNSGYGISVTTFNWGSNMTIANSGITLSIAAEITGDEKYAEAAETALHYLLGRNPNGVCYVSGYGTVSPLNPHHRPSMAAGQAMPGMLVGGVNENLEDSAAKAYLATVPAAKCYVDHSESYSTNEITIYWNSPLTYLMSLIEDVEEEAPVQGDVNADGSFTVADVVMMQKYLLGIGTLTDMNAGNVADSDSAASINIFDLAVMKKMIAEN
jgi:endoglucanase